jgi:two-component system chemotaxis sensor kinase CheA
MFESDDSFINDYLAESREHLADIETDLLAIEVAGAAIDEQLVNKVFRAAHSIKGGAGFFSLTKIQELGHKTENVLDLIRSREMIPTADVVNILLMAFDCLREMINNHKESQQRDIAELVVALSGLVSAHLSAAQKPSLTKMVKVTAPGVKAVFTLPEFDLNRAKDAGRYLYLVEYDLIDDVQRRGKRPTDVLFILQNTGDILESLFEIEAAGTLDDEPSSRLPFYILFSSSLGPETSDVLFDVPNSQIHLIHAPAPEKKPIVEMGVVLPAVQPVPVQTALPAAEAAPKAVAQPQTLAHQQIVPQPQSIAAPKTAAAPAPTVAETTLRVEVNLIEVLMNLAGELVLSRNQLMEAINSSDRHNMVAGAQRINLVTSELQEAIMQTRMQPVGNIFNKYPRVVRDLSRDLGKEVNLEVIGREVEMDKTIIEGLSEPLTHMVRNAIDHGIEMPAARIAAGKLPTGTVHLKAYYEAGQVIVEVGDDGAGIDPQRVANSAVKKGLISQDQVKAMSQKEMMGLIFLPGLSTASQVSDVSGRGVGMDVVKTNLDRLGGKIEIESSIGKGTTFFIKLPLTLAIIPSLLVSVNSERYAIPQVHINELLHITAEQVKKRVEVVGNAEVLVLRGSLIPIVRLGDVLGVSRVLRLPDTGEVVADRRGRIADRRSPQYNVDGTLLTVDVDTAQAMDERRGDGRRNHPASDLNLVIMTAGMLRYGLIVDELHDTAEIVVKPLGRHLKGLREYAGATILGDGRVALILDASGIAAKQNLVSMAGSKRAKELAEEARRDEAAISHAFITFRNAADEYCAVPMDLVERVTQVTNAQIEGLGGRRTMQYRSGSLPLVTLKDCAAVKEISPQQDKAVVIFNVLDREIGLLVGMPVDVVETSALIDQQTLRQPGVFGSAIVNQHTTLILEIYELVEAMYPDLKSHERVQVADVSSGKAPLILLVEDSDFFRSQVQRYLEADGFSVWAAEDGQVAWELLHKDAARAASVQLVVTDVEMPRMDGLSLTRALRADPRFVALPVIALSSLAGEEDENKAKAAGVNEYQIKLDRNKLLECVQRVLQRSRPEREAAE